jgi:hypothetical protein
MWTMQADCRVPVGSNGLVSSTNAARLASKTAAVPALPVALFEK